MENTTKPEQKFQLLDGKKFDFGSVWSNFIYLINNAFDLFLSDAMNFVLLFTLPVLLGGIIAQIVLPYVFGALIYSGPVGLLIGLVIFIVCTVMLSLIAYLATVKAVVEKAKEGKFDLAGYIRFGVKNVVPSIKLSIKTIMALGGGWKKFVNSLLSLIYFVESAAPNVDEALKTSQNTCEGKSVTVLWGLLMMSVISGLAQNIFTQVWWTVTIGFSYYVAAIGGTLAYGMVGALTIIYQMNMRDELSEAVVSMPAQEKNTDSMAQAATDKK